MMSENTLRAWQNIRERMIQEVQRGNREIDVCDEHMRRYGKLIAAICDINTILMRSAIDRYSFLT